MAFKIRHYPYLVIMNARINQLVKSLLQKDSIEQCSLHELQQFADRHPYFGAAQLLLTKKMQTEQSEKFNDQLQKTYLFFHNPMWVEHLLNDTGNATIKTAEKKEIAVTPIPEITTTNSVAEEIVTAPEPEELQIETPTIAEQVIDNKTTAAEERIATELEENIEEHEISPVADEALPMQIPGLKMEPFDPSKAELTFEPFHTVDYFASQGINFKEEEKPKDKFGIQLKSFTDWLKTMKRLPATEIAKQVENSGGEQKVEQLAEHSLQEREVITEAMAEVWEKQGNQAKAIAIYSKLSLLEPSKSRYFAAKIEDLKKIN